MADFDGDDMPGAMFSATPLNPGRIYSPNEYFLALGKTILHGCTPATKECFQKAMYPRTPMEEQTPQQPLVEFREDRLAVAAISILHSYMEASAGGTKDCTINFKIPVAEEEKINPHHSVFNKTTPPCNNTISRHLKPLKQSLKRLCGSGKKQT